MSEDLQFPRATPSTRDMLDRVKWDVTREINCHLIGKIESVDLAKNTVSVSSAFKKRMSNGEELDYPLFVDVPLFVPSGGGAFFFIPPKKGDWCLLMFCDRNIDTWWYSGEVRAPNTPRAHSLSDGLAIVGFRPQSDPLTLTDDAVTLHAESELIRIKNDQKNLKVLVDKLFDLIAAIKPLTTIATLGTPTLGTLDPATVAAIPLLKAEFALLLKE
jgi:hypothetical protein